MSTTQLETWRGAFSPEEQTRWLFLRQHNHDTGFLNGLEPQYRAEYLALNARLHRFCQQLNDAESAA